jgi:hypothetical protein
MDKRYIAIGVGILVLLTALFVLALRKAPPSSEEMVSHTSLDMPQGIPAVTTYEQEGHRRYTNDTYHFSLVYPEELKVLEYAESGDARTVTFEEVEGKKGFQVYISAYPDDQITQERIQRDTRNTLEGTPQEAMVGDIRALIFFSRNPLFGRMREVWFIKNGYLFEVTTYADQDTWLAGIMQTWRFE